MIWLWVNLHYGGKNAVPQTYQFLSFYCESDDSRAEKPNKMSIKCILKKDKWKKKLFFQLTAFAFFFNFSHIYDFEIIKIFFQIFQIYNFYVSTCFIIIACFLNGPWPIRDWQILEFRILATG